MPGMCDEYGCSLVIVRTERGAKVLAECLGNVELQAVSYKEAVRDNICEHESVAKPSERDRFFNDLRTRGYDWVARHYARMTLKEGIYKVKGLVRNTFVPTGALGIINRLRGAPSLNQHKNRMRYGIRFELDSPRDDSTVQHITNGFG